MNKSEKSLRNLLRVWTVLFGTGALVFLLAGPLMFQWMNNLSRLVTPTLPLIAESREKFWLVLTTSLMVTLTALCYQAQRDIRQNYQLVTWLLISKLVSTLFFTLFFFTEGCLAYLIGGLFCDGPIFFITLIFYRRLVKGHVSPWQL